VRTHPLVTALVVLVGACSASEQGTPGQEDAQPSTYIPGKVDQFGDAWADAAAEDVDRPIGVDWGRDILRTDLSIDLAAGKGVATIQIAPAESSAVSLEVKGLEIRAVSSAGATLRHAVTEGRLDIEVPAQNEAIEFRVEYSFSVQHQFDGYLDNGLSFLWPYFCSNLFPCKSSPSDGVQFTMQLTGLPAGKQAIYPLVIPSDAPSYMPAIAVGDFSYQGLGSTKAGTKVGVWYLTGDKSAAVEGTKELTGIFDWFETTYGAYPFGKEVASVSADWGPGAYGGMEHHPYWHVARSAMSDPVVHVHEAAHGWFGNGIRIRCWEDFVLSEGTSTYLTARGFTAVAGAAEGDKVWAGYRSELQAAVASGDTPAWPDKACNSIDILHDPLWSSIPYMKGAHFYKAVADQVGVELLDEVLAKFYVDHVGKTAGMQNMLDAIASGTGFDPAPLAQAWLRGMGIPAQ
jgi:aminopeptidase N